MIFQEDNINQATICFFILTMITWAAEVGVTVQVLQFLQPSGSILEECFVEYASTFPLGKFGEVAIQYRESQILFGFHNFLVK